MSGFSHKAARLRYGDNGFRVIESGGFVLCAVTGTPIPLAGLRYWSVDLQEAYCNASAAMTRMQAAADRRREAAPAD